MKKILLLIIFAIFSVNTFSQSKTDSFRIFQSGSNTLTNGECTIILNQECDNYTVTLTEVGKSSDLYVLRKNKKSFTIKSDIVMNANFDYIVTEKKTKQRLQDDSILKWKSDPSN